jgi:2,4-dienoyl-CoA reductase-like NADH-dependent reductase (Old Yellow Enzyme family)
MSVAHIKQTIQDYCKAAKTAMEIGFDGVEIHGGNGYLPEQFLSSNVNKRTDDYGGSPEKRCQFVFELMAEVAKTIGEQNLAIRLSPFGLFNQARGEQRLETWTHLCEGLKKDHPTLSYVSFVEPVYLPVSVHGFFYNNLTLIFSAMSKSSAKKRRIASSRAGD